MESSINSLVHKETAPNRSESDQARNWPTNWIKIKDESPDLLTQCRGFRGQVCEYLIGHSQLLARFYAPRPLADTLLYCTACDFVSFHAYWDKSDVRISISRDKHGPIFEITDGERLRIVCRTASLAESRKLVLSIPHFDTGSQ
jgi:hypothetical protein